MRLLLPPTLLALALGACSSPPSAAGSPASASPNGVQSQDDEAAAGTPAAPVPTEGPGVAVGERAPAFSLADQSGKTRSLDEWLGKDRLVAIVFYRSADW
ncbi:MAG: hypothetical protein AAF799_23405 [Myxococcota bacterium]